METETILSLSGFQFPKIPWEFFRDLEKHLNALAMKKTKEVEKIGRSFARYDQGDFSLLKVDKSEQERFTQRFIPPNFPIKISLADFGSFAGLSEASRKRKPIPHPTKLINMHSGDKLFSP